MKNPKFTKTMITGALILGLSATGATVWASTNNTFKTLPNANTVGTSSNSGTSANISLTDAYATYVQAAYGQINAALQAKDMTQAKMTTSDVEKELNSINQMIQEGKTSEAEQSLKNATVKIDSSAGAQSTIDSTQQTSTTRHGSADTGGDNTSSGKNGVSADQQDNKDSGDMGHDTLALAAALQHVGNAKAQLSLEKNIAKEFSHLTAQLQQLSQQTMTDTTNRASVTVTPDNTATTTNTNAHSTATGNTTGATHASDPTAPTAPADHSADHDSTNQAEATSGDDGATKLAKSQLGIQLGLGAKNHVNDKVHGHQPNQANNGHGDSAKHGHEGD